MPQLMHTKTIIAAALDRKSSGDVSYSDAFLRLCTTLETQALFQFRLTAISSDRHSLPTLRAVEHLQRTSNFMLQTKLFAIRSSKLYHLLQ
jgi:hypothetical protein